MISSGLMSHFARVQTTHLQGVLGERGGWGGWEERSFSYSSGNETEIKESKIRSFYFSCENVNSPYRSTYVSFKVGSENWVVH